MNERVEVNGKLGTVIKEDKYNVTVKLDNGKVVTVAAYDVIYIS